MAGVLFGAMAYALLNYLLGLRQWAVDDADLPIGDDEELLQVAVADLPILATPQALGFFRIDRRHPVRAKQFRFAAVAP